MLSIIDKMIEDFQKLGLQQGSVVLVHSSLRSLGKVEGGAESVIQALLTVLGEDSTLLMPALSYKTVTPSHPHFNVSETPSCVGALTEYFRKRDGTLRSIHPTHSVCGVGKLAQEILANHINDSTPCGTNSPFHKLPHYNGYVLFIGCGLRPNTSMHAVEELVEPPYLYGDMVDFYVTNANQNVSQMPIRTHDFKGWQQRYERLEQLLDDDAISSGKVLAATCHLIDASVMWRTALEKLQTEPLFFVDRKI